MSYITFNEYKNLGGKVDESAFNILIIEAEAKLNFITNGKLDKFINWEISEELPTDIKMLVVKTIDLIEDSKSLVEVTNKGISSYSNGIESISYDTSRKPSDSISTGIYNLCKEYLWNYPNILYRGK